MVRIRRQFYYPNNHKQNWHKHFRKWALFFHWITSLLSRYDIISIIFVISILNNIYFDVDINPIVNLKISTLMPSGGFIIGVQEEILIYLWSSRHTLSETTKKFRVQNVLFSLSSFDIFGIRTYVLHILVFFREYSPEYYYPWGKRVFWSSVSGQTFLPFHSWRIYMSAVNTNQNNFPIIDTNKEYKQYFSHKIKLYSIYLFITENI